MKKKIIALLLSATMLLSCTATAFASTTDSSSTGDSEVNSVVALGANLTDDQKNTVLSYMGLTTSDLENMDVISITNDEEHQYLDAYLDSSVIGTKSLSSVYVQKLDDGAGLDIETHNINYCTISMYSNALITAGLSDAKVIVAAPTEISGTAALIGAVKAYAEMTGTEVNEESLETATEELVVTGELGDILGDSDDAAELIAYAKQVMLEEGLDTTEEIEQAVRDAADKYGYELTDDEVDQIVSLLEKINTLDIDADALKEQASALFDKLGLDSNSVGSFFSNIVDNIVSFFKGLFN